MRRGFLGAGIQESSKGSLVCDEALAQPLIITSRRYHPFV
jgi:hypothetical protein